MVVPGAVCAAAGEAGAPRKVATIRVAAETGNGWRVLCSLTFLPVLFLQIALFERLIDIYSDARGVCRSVEVEVAE
jgi:hypothetical protein